MTRGVERADVVFTFVAVVVSVTMLTAPVAPLAAASPVPARSCEMPDHGEPSSTAVSCCALDPAVPAMPAAPRSDAGAQTFEVLRGFDPVGLSSRTGFGSPERVFHRRAPPIDLYLLLVTLLR